jgi:hypothetical protein
MMMGREACHHFLVNFLGVEDDDEPLGLLLSLGFFPQMEKMTTSWEAPGSLSSPRFFSSIVPLLVCGDIATPLQIQR